MANRNLTVIAKVRDSASGPLKKVSESIRRTGKATKKAGLNFTEFNRIMFSTSAFIGMFSNSFRRISDLMTEGARIDRVSEQFENAFGDKGKFFKTISSLTDNTIDRMEAMKAGIAMNAMGISSDMGQVANTVARAGTAAKMAGLDSAQGIKKYLEFIKSGSVAHLSFLNIIAETNPKLQSQLALLEKAGGPLGKVISTQQKLTIGQNLLAASTENALKGQRDQLDIIQDMSQSFKHLRSEMGRFLNLAFGPLVEKMISGTKSFENFMKTIVNTDGSLLKFVKNMTLAVGTLGTFLGTLGTLRLTLKAMGALGLGGIPGITLAIATMAASFTDMSKVTSTVVEKFKLFGSATLGVFQLMSSFFHNTENMEKGIGKIDSAILKLLDENGLKGIVIWLAKAGVATVEFGKGLAEGLATSIDYIYDKFKSLIGVVAEFLGMDTQAWSKDFMQGVRGIGKFLGLIAPVLAGGYLGFKMLGGGSKGPKGTPSDPIYTKDASKTGIIGTTLGQSYRRSAEQSFLGTEDLPGEIKGSLSTILGGLLGGLTTKVGALASTISSVISRFTKLVTPLGLTFLGLRSETIGDNVANTPAFNRILEASQAAGVQLLENDQKRFARQLQTNVGQAQQEMQLAKFRRGIFEKKFETPGKIGVDTETGTISNIPTMPQSEKFKIEQVQRTMEMVNEDVAFRMKNALTQAMTQTSEQGKQITPEEWKEIFKSGMNESEVADNTRQAVDNNDVAKLKRGC